MILYAFLLVFTVAGWGERPVVVSSEFKAVESSTVTAAPVGRFDGTWAMEANRSGIHVGLSVMIKQSGGKLTGEYGGYSSKESNGKILKSRIAGNSAILEIDNDWGGRGTVKITLLKGNRLHWKVIKRQAKSGEFIVLVDAILKRQ